MILTSRSFESPKNDYDDNNSNNNNNPSYAITTTVAATTTTTANNNNNSNNKNNVSNNNNNNNSIRNSRSKSSIRRQLRRQQSSNEVSKSTHPGYTIRVEGTYSEAGNVKATQGTLYRIKRALMLGASAIILMTLNPQILKELDVSQIFFHPIIILDVMDNVTNLFLDQGQKLKAKVKIMFNGSNFDLQKSTKVTLWSTCGRSSCWSYPTLNCVVCLSNIHKNSKADPGNFWNFFYCGLLSLMMLFVLKTRRRNCDYELDVATYQLASRVLNLIGTQSYQQPLAYGEYYQDTCAICLDHFSQKQNLRVLPCYHAYHSECVDPWIVKNHTCPLCKLNIVEKVCSDNCIQEYSA
ncbi:RING finger protein 215 [Octopus bimaculoides]|nr:RING finger protein 215 [Octopus bimaculoides]|eukprot:XP_014778043.1 PREDICTED: RING finger protein 215-like isoform X2 [Octopus bimaculoides]